MSANDVEPTAALKILIVESERDSMQQLVRKFLAMGHHALSADRLAVTQTDYHRHVDVAIFDARTGLNSLDGITRQMRQRGIPFLFYADSAGDVAENESSVPVILKGMNSDALQRLVDSVVDRAVAAR